MYAIIADGASQYHVSEGDEFDIDFRELSPGAELKFDRVLVYSDGDKLQLGVPALSGASVIAEVVGPRMGEKLVVQKLRRRKNSRRKTGHRQMYTVVKINKISI